MGEIMASFVPSASLFLGIIPALILLYISIKGYEHHAKPKNIYVSFIVGIVIGFIASIIELLTSADVGLSFIILYPILEQLFKVIILNARRLQEKQATVVYGLVLGLGFGAISTPVSLIIGNIQGGDYTLLGLVIIGSTGIIMFQGATGVLIGYGVYTNKLWTYVVFSVLIHIPITVGVFLSSFLTFSYAQIVVVLCMFFYGAFLYWYATRRIMFRLTSEGLRRKRTKKDIDIKT